MNGRVITVSGVVFLLVIAAGASSARAQMPTVDPRGATSAPPPSQPAAQPVEPIFVPPPGQGGQQSGEADESGFYYLPEDLAADSIEAGGPPAGAVPLFHEVRSGDTLWDICWYYFNNPWEWPRIWSYNPGITNPHWIYPGDRVRLYPEGEEPQQASDLTSSLEQQMGAEQAPADPGPVSAPPPPLRGVRLRQLAFVDEESRKQAATIVGAVEEKTLLAAGDSVYLDYPADRPLEAGDRYSVYTETRPVKHPETGEAVGSFVRLLGELRVVSVVKGKRARAVITDSVDVIERGARVGSLPRTFRTVEPTRAEADVQGTIVATLGTDALIGQGQVVFIDKGGAEGVKVGNRMYVVRRGDAYENVMSPGFKVGQDDRQFPDRAIGEVLIVQVGKHASAALVTLALHEIGVGERVLMRKAK